MALEFVHQPGKVFDMAWRSYTLNACSVGFEAGEIWLQLADRWGNGSVGETAVDSDYKVYMRPFGGSTYPGTRNKGNKLLQK